MVLEDIAERYEAMSWRRRLKLGGIALVIFVVLGVGLNTIVAGVVKRHPHLLKALPKSAGPSKSAGPGGGSEAADQSLKSIHQASFAYLMPKSSADWHVDDASQVYAADRGIVKYDVVMTNASTRVAITEQALPEQLGTRKSAAFTTFIDANKPARSLDTGEGTLYFLPATQNGVAAAGSDTVIFATDHVLMFGRAERVVGWEGWTKLMAAMKSGL